MKQFVFLLCTIFIVFSAHAQTETTQWYVDGELYDTTTCESGGDILLPATPTKRGYTFMGWRDYVPIEYLESSASAPQWIDTGFVPNQDTRVITKFYTTTTTITIFGARKNAGKLSFDAILVDTTRIRSDYNSSLPYISCGSTDCLIGQNFTLDKNKNTTSLYNDSKSIDVYLQTTYSNFESGVNMYIFNLNTNNQVPTTSASFKIYYFQIYDNDILVRDFIPVLDPAGVPCMYDKIENKYYYNAGTGDFTAGPIINE